ncbi:unnamed protein product, partial [Phaeothamnion confervicola]
QESSLRPSLSRRVLNTDPAHIEIILSRFANLPDRPANLAQGVAFWGPPKTALATLAKSDGDDAGKMPPLEQTRMHRYGDILGDPELRAAIARKLISRNGLDLAEQEIMVTAGANQAFVNVALALLDPGDVAILPRPYYCSHLCALQLAGATPVFCGYDPATLLPDMDELRALLLGEKNNNEMNGSESHPSLPSRPPPSKMLVLTSPGNPSGAVLPPSVLSEVAALCRARGVWLVMDETYEDFIHDDGGNGSDDSGCDGSSGGNVGSTVRGSSGKKHVSPCARRLSYDGIVHIFSMSKAFGMAGWRVGYLVYPAWAGPDMQKVQDTVPTCASMASQQLALACLTVVDDSFGARWIARRVAGLARPREALWAAVRHTGAVRGGGAFYYLVPLP